MTPDRNQLALDEMPRKAVEVVSHDGGKSYRQDVAFWINIHYETIKAALTAQTVTDDELKLAIDWVTAAYPDSEYIPVLIRAATAPKCDALMKAFEEEITLIDQTIRNIHDGRYKSFSDTDIEVSISRQRARLTEALAAHKAQGGV